MQYFLFLSHKRKLHKHIWQICIILYSTLTFGTSFAQTSNNNIYMPPHALGKWLNRANIYCISSRDSIVYNVGGNNIVIEPSITLLIQGISFWYRSINDLNINEYNTSTISIPFYTTNVSDTLGNTNSPVSLFGFGNNYTLTYDRLIEAGRRNFQGGLTQVIVSDSIRRIPSDPPLNERTQKILRVVQVEINKDFWDRKIIEMQGGRLLLFNPFTNFSIDARYTATHEMGHFFGMSGDRISTPDGSIMRHDSQTQLDSAAQSWPGFKTDLDDILMQSIYPQIPGGRRGCTPRILATLSNGSTALLPLLSEDSFGAINSRILEPWLLYHHPVTRAWRSLIQNSTDELITAVNHDNALQAALNSCIAHNLDFFDSQVGANPLPLSRDNIQHIVEFLRTLSAQKNLSPQTLTSILNLIEVVQDSEGKTLWRILLDMLHGDVRPFLDAQNKQPRSGDALEKPFVFPNPALADRTALVYFLPQRSFVTLRLFNSTGQYIETVAQGMYEAGELQLEIDMKHLTSGAYFYRLQVNDANLSGKIILSR